MPLRKLTSTHRHFFERVRDLIDAQKHLRALCDQGMFIGFSVPKIRDGVNADALHQNLENSGHRSFYWVLLDTGKTELKRKASRAY